MRSAAGDETERKSEHEEVEDVSYQLAYMLSPSSFWGRPLALVAVLLASHAAALLLGAVLGAKHQAACQSSYAGGGDMCLTRRFSSGPYGTHARLAW